MSVPAALKFTYHDYCLLPEDRRYEVVDGELFLTPAPTLGHQEVVLRLVRILADFVETQRLGKVYVAPCDVVLSDVDVLQPDIFFVSAGRLSILGEKYVAGAPDLVVEVLSPSTEERDRVAKAKRYATFGACEMWLVDPGSRTIEVLVNAADGFEQRGVFGPGDVLHSTIVPALELPIGSVFRAA